MLPRIFPYKNKLKTYISDRKSLSDVAVSTEIIQQEEMETRPPSIFLEEEIEKVTASQAPVDLPTEIARARGGTVTHRPTIRYGLKNALVFANGVSVNGTTVARFGPLPHRQLLFGPVTRLDRAAYANSQTAMRFFGHWLTDACATALLCGDDETLILPIRNDWPHSGQYAKIFEFPRDPNPVFYVESLAMFDDVGHGSNRKQRYLALREQIRTKIPVQGSNKVYVRRGSLGVARTILNEDDVIRSLMDRGFEVLEPEAMTSREILDRTLDAEAIVSLEGSHLSHACYFLRNNGLILTLQQSDRFCNVYKDYANTIGLRYGFIVAEGATELGYTVNIDSLNRTLDLAAI